MPPLSPAVSLAVQMHSQPGVFAVLLGSGVSRGANIPTGWEVVTDLVRIAATARAAAAGQSPPPLSSDGAIEQWWREHGDGEIGYSQVLAALADRPAGRQALLEPHFAPTDADGQPRPPSTAHTALARLVAAGHVRVILTTNFDRLTEQALHAHGIDPQVISRPEAVAGMQPLTHAPATVIKLHGDYKDLTTRNTVDELDTYPPEWTSLLERIVDEYGLLISGWSADWDAALVGALHTRRTRRYPLFWDNRSSRGNAARQLIAQQSGQIITAPDADTLFTELAESVTALSAMAEPPITTAIAVARVKRYLPDPLHRIDLHELTLSRINPIREVADRYANGPGDDSYTNILDAYQRATYPLLALLVTGVRYDDGTHQHLWGDVLDRLLALHHRPLGGIIDTDTRNALLYPALLAFYAMNAADIAAHHGALMIHLGLNHTHPYSDLHTDRLVPIAGKLRADELLTGLAPSGGFGSPTSHQLRTHLRDVLTDISADSVDTLLNDVEFRHALLLAHIATTPAIAGRFSPRPLSGQFRGPDRYSTDQHATLTALGQRLQADANTAGDTWPWTPMTPGVGDSARGFRAVELIERLDS